MQALVQIVNKMLACSVFPMTVFYTCSHNGLIAPIINAGLASFIHVHISTWKTLHLRLRNARRVFQYSVHNIVKLEWSYDSATPTRLQASLIMRWRYSACGQRRFQHDSQTALCAATFRFLRLQSTVCDPRHVRWVTASLDIARTRPPNLCWLLFPQLFTFQQNNNDKLYPEWFMKTVW